MQKTAAQLAYARFRKYAEGYPVWGGDEYLTYPEIQELQQQADIDAFQNPYYESPLERKRKMQGTGASIGSGAGLLGGALAGSLIPKSTLAKIIAGTAGGLGGLSLGGLGGWGAGTLLAKHRMGEEYPEE